MTIPSSDSPVISIVIPCLGHASELASNLQAFQQQQGDLRFEVIVVDSACDPEVESVTRRFPRVKLVRPDTDCMLSSGAARNLGVQNAAASVIGFMDADCAPHPGWVKAALQAVEDGAVLAGGPVLDQMPWHWIASTDNRLQFVDFPAGRPAGMAEYVPGAHLVVSRSMFTAVGGFDETVLIAQDMLFAAKIAQRHPRDVRFCPQMIAYHQGRTQWRGFLRHQRDFGYARAEFGIRMKRDLFWLGEREYLGWFVALRRLGYISLRVIQWNLVDLPRYLLQLPPLLIGLLAWTRGFYAGMRNRAGAKSPTL